MSEGNQGLGILLSVVAAVFVIGFLVMLFAIMGANLVTTQREITNTRINSEAGFINNTGYTLAGASYQGGRGFTILTAMNTSDGVIISSGNWTLSDTGLIKNKTARNWNAVKFNYTFTYDANTSATEAITDTVDAIADTPTWFPVIITVAVMVALILMTVLIIQAIRGTGLLAGAQ